jgi:hypothetical protein
LTVTILSNLRQVNISHSGGDDLEKWVGQALK